MAEPATTEPSQNALDKPGRNHSGQFEPGNKLGVVNKGGRPKELARRVRESVEIAGGDQNMLVTIMVQIATGYRQMIHPTEIDPKTKKPVETWEAVTVSDQQAAIRWLADRGYGKAREFEPIENDGDPLDLGGDLAAVAAGVRQRVDELAARRRAREAEDAASVGDG